MGKSWVVIAAVVMFSGCTTSYPYLVTTDGCNCERFTYRGEGGRLEIEVSARYEVRDRITSTVEILFRNRSREDLSLRQGYLKGTSANVRYQANDQFKPLPYVVIPPGGKQSVTLEGGDTEEVDNPWLKIAGERVVLEIRGLLLGGKALPPVVLTLIPYNPKTHS